MLSAEVLHQRGLEASNTGRYHSARRCYLRALERAGDDQDLTARIEGSLAYVEAELGQPERALALCEAALRRPGVSEHTLGIVTSQRGLLAMRRGDTQAALRDLTDALDRLDGEPEFVGRLHLNRGNVHLQRGDAVRAGQDFQDAQAHLERAGLPVLLAKAQHNLGYTRLLTGDLVGALHAMDAARPVLAPLSEVSRAVGQQDRAEVLVAAGLATEGDQALAEAARAYGSRRLRQYQGEVELVRARTLTHRDPVHARRVARQASRRFRAQGSVVWALRADAAALSASVAAGGRSPRLVEDADALLPSLRRERLLVDEALVELSAVRVLLRSGRTDAAVDRLRRFRLSADAPTGVRLLCHEVRADLARARGRDRRAFAGIRDGLRELAAWQASFGSLDLQSGLVGHGRQLAVDGLRMAVADGRPEVLLEWSERARGLASRVTPVRPPGDEAVTAELAELRWLQAGQPDPRSPSGRRLAELQEAVREHAWYAGSGEVSEPCGLSALRAGLGPGMALVAYVATADQVVALVVTDSSAVVRPLGGRGPLDALLGGLHADLDLAGSDLPAAFAGPVRAALGDRLRRLDGLLVGPLLGDVGDRRLLLTPSGVLAGVPWGLLPGLAGRPVTVARSATSWLGRQSGPVGGVAADLVAGLVAGPGVPRAEAEVTAAAGVWDSPRVLTGVAATAAAVSELAGAVDVLHVSAHGRHSAENPLFSGVELVDGPWFGYDIDQVARVPEVVLLSACEVGRSQVRYGEELVGMTTAWLHAGARCVIASPAAVNDEAAHDVLVGVHQGLGAGLDPSAALAAALPPASADAPPAPFVCFS